MTVDGSDPRLAWARYALARSVLAKVTAATRSAGIDILAVKGVVTSEWLYGDRSERLLTDVDIRIRASDFGRLLALSRAQGWETARCVWSYLNADFKIDGIFVDIEGTIGPPGLVALSVDQMLQRASRNPQGFWVPDVHDHAVLMTVNVFKDRLADAAPWAVEDLRRVVDVEAFDPRKYVERIHEGRVAGLAWIVADWMVAHHESESWADLRARLGGDAPRRSIYARAVRRAVEHTSPASAPLHLRILMRAASDDLWRASASLLVAAAWELESRLDARRRA